MIRDIPRTPFWLGVLGLLPMVWGVGETYLPFVKGLAEDWGNGWFFAPYATLRYAQLILGFMSGVLWGFAARASGTTASMGYVLSVLPALYSYFLLIGGVSDVAVKMAIGFVLVLGLDRVFHAQKLTPEWWMRFRVMLTVPMVACLLLLAWAHRI